MKQCNKCSLEKPLSEFYKDKGTKDGYSYPCKLCDNKKRNVSYSKNIEAYRERHRKWRQKNKNELNIFFWNKRASSHNLSGELLQNTFLSQNKMCYYCNVSLTYPNFQVKHSTPKNNSKIVISCSDCNHLKWTRTE